MDENVETNDAKNENARRTDEMVLRRSRVEAQQQAEGRNDSSRRIEVTDRENAQLGRTGHFTSDELAKAKIETAESGVRHSRQDALEQNPTEAAVIRKLNETPESERRAWEKAQFERVRRPTPDELAKLKVDETNEARPESREASFEAKPEHVRLASAVESIEKIDDLKPERWRELTPQRRTVALQHAGRALRDAYDCPDPPLLPSDFPEYRDGKTLLGFYQDGATRENLDSDYVIRMNEKLLQHDDPSKALETYSHEFRHAYQAEMANRYEKPQFRNMVHDKNAAAKWSENIKKYNDPENDFAEYRKQAIEEDARAFSQKLVSQIYGKTA